MIARTSSPLTDAELIAASCRHPERFAEIFDRHWSRIRRSASAGPASRPVRTWPPRSFASPWTDAGATTSRTTPRRRGYSGSRTLLAHDRRRHARQSRALARLRPRADPDVAESALDRVQAQALGPELTRALDGISTAGREALLLYVWAELATRRSPKRPASRSGRCAPASTERGRGCRSLSTNRRPSVDRRGQRTLPAKLLFHSRRRYGTVRGELRSHSRVHAERG